jgi:hypothetical protein
MTLDEARRAATLAALAFALIFTGCAGGHPPPGPIDLVREVFDPDYDYRYADRAERDRDADDRWGADHGPRACAASDLACSHEGRTVCCSRSDGYCAGADGPYCCDRGVARRGYGADRGWDWDD